jgi:cell division protein FtsB
MGSYSTVRTGLRQLAGPMFGVCAIVYFGFHVIHGDRGLLTYMQLKQGIAETRPVLDAARVHREQLAQRVRLLHPDNLDLDMLEERARIMLNYGYVDDVIILYEGEPTL